MVQIAPELLGSLQDVGIFRLLVDTHQHPVLHQELAARAVALSAGLKTAFEAQSLDLVAMLEGNPKKSGPFIERLDQLIDEAMSEYAKPVELEVTFTDAGSDEE